MRMESSERRGFSALVNRPLAAGGPFVSASPLNPAANLPAAVPIRAWPPPAVDDKQRQTAISSGDAKPPPQFHPKNRSMTSILGFVLSMGGITSRAKSHASGGTLRILGTELETRNI